MSNHRYIDSIYAMRKNNTDFLFNAIFNAMRQLPKNSVAITDDKDYFIDRYGCLWRNYKPISEPHSFYELCNNNGRVYALGMNRTLYEITDEIRVVDKNPGFDHLCTLYDGGLFVINKNGTLSFAEKKNYDFPVKSLRSWSDISELAGCHKFVAGLHSDGTVICTDPTLTGNNGSVSDWQKIVEICCFKECLFGIKADGTVAYACKDEKNCGIYNIDDVPKLTSVISLHCLCDKTFCAPTDGTKEIFPVLDSLEIDEITAADMASNGFDNIIYYYGGDETKMYCIDDKGRLYQNIYDETEVFTDCLPVKLYKEDLLKSELSHDEIIAEHSQLVRNTPDKTVIKFDTELNFSLKKGLLGLFRS